MNQVLVGYWLKTLPTVMSLFFKYARIIEGSLYGNKHTFSKTCSHLPQSSFNKVQKGSMDE
jgi:hypothetical protein